MENWASLVRIIDISISLTPTSERPGGSTPGADHTFSRSKLPRTCQPRGKSVRRSVNTLRVNEMGAGPPAGSNSLYSTPSPQAAGEAGEGEAERPPRLA